MKNVEEDINKAKAIIYEEYNYTDSFEKYCRIYPFTNENLIRCFNNFDLQMKKCLTVLGSSDQAFDMCLRGASEITTFDINVLTKHYFYLKRAAILSNLTKEEYINFFFPNFNINYTKSYQLFSKISQNISGDTLIFWTKLFEEFKPDVISRSLFSNDTNEKQELKNNIYYLKNNEFYSLKEKLKDMDIKFINTDIKNLPDKLSEMYDFIYLSNIMYYAKRIFSNQNKSEALKAYKKLIFELSKHLNIDGNIIVCYFFSKCIHYGVSQEIFTEKNFNFKSFREFKDESILQYTKKYNTK